jgi:hypothetical protein
MREAQRLQQPGDMDLSACFPESYLESAIEAAIYYEKLAGESEAPKPKLPVDAMGNILSLFQSKDEKLVHFVTRALELACNQTVTENHFQRVFEMIGEGGRFVVSKAGMMELGPLAC